MALELAGPAAPGSPVQIINKQVLGAFSGNSPLGNPGEFSAQILEAVYGSSTPEAAADLSDTLLSPQGPTDLYRLDPESQLTLSLIQAGLTGRQLDIIA